MQFLRSLRHRNIVFFYGAGNLTTEPFLVTEYMARGTLCDVLYGTDGHPAEPITVARCVVALHTCEWMLRHRQ